MAKSGKLKRYHSGIRNLHKRLNNMTKEGREARKEFYVRTKDKAFKEMTFIKNLNKGKAISIKSARSAFKIAKSQRNSQLKLDYIASKKAGNKGSFKQFKQANREPDWQLIQEMFNSPK